MRDSTDTEKMIQLITMVWREMTKEAKNKNEYKERIE